MDKLSLEVLKKLKGAENATAWKTVIDTFGKSATKSLSFLEGEGYIKSGRIPIGVDSNSQLILKSDGLYSITSKGLAFLEEKPGKDFDRWLTRFCAILGAITGTAALIAEIVLHFL